jgi:hypothetical protein
VSSLWRGVSAGFHFLELATVGGRFYFSKGALTCCQGGRHFDLLWGRAINPCKNYLFPHIFLQFLVVMLYMYYLCLSLWRGGHRLFPFSWVSHGRRSIFFLQRGPYTLPRGQTFWLALGSSYKPLQNLPVSALFFVNFTFTCYSISGWVCEGASRLGSIFLS